MEKFLMCRIKQGLQKVGLKTFDQKKGRVLERTRPEPTIFGNCESWEIIVGKKREKHRRGRTNGAPGADTQNFTNNLSTCFQQGFEQNGESADRRPLKFHNVNYGAPFLHL
jgi:hypothetical protein